MWFYFLCSSSSGLPQQERRDQPSEGGQSGQGICGQIQTCSETQERGGLREGTGRSDGGHEYLRQPMRRLKARAATPVANTCSHVRLTAYLTWRPTAGYDLRLSRHNCLICSQLQSGTFFRFRAFYLNLNNEDTLFFWWSLEHRLFWCLVFGLSLPRSGCFRVVQLRNLTGDGEVVP